MISPFFIYSCLATLISRIISVSSNKPENATHNSRVICLLGKTDSNFNGPNTAIELTAGLSTEDFFSKNNGAVELPIYFKLKIFHFQGRFYRDMAEIEVETIFRNTIEIDLSNFKETKLVLENKSISELLGTQVQEKLSSGNSGLEDEQHQNFLDKIKFKISLHLEKDSNDKQSSIKDIFLEPESLKVPKFQTLWVTHFQDMNFPFKIEVFGRLKCFWEKYLTEKLSQEIFTNRDLLDRSYKVRDEATSYFKQFLHNDSLHVIFRILNRLEGPLRDIIRYSAQNVNLLSHFLQIFNQNPDQSQKYYHKGLVRVFDPFRTFQDSYQKNYRQHEVENINWSSFLEIDLKKEIIEKGNKILQFFKVNRGNAMKRGWTPVNSYSINVPFFSFDQGFFKVYENDKQKPTPTIKVDIKKIDEIKNDYERNLKEIEEIINPSKVNPKGKGSTTCPLQSFDFILQKLNSKRKGATGEFSSLFIFKSGQGYVLRNYLRLIRSIIGEKIKVKIINNPEIPEDERESGKIKLIKTPISKFILKLIEFLGVKDFGNRKIEIEGFKKDINRSHMGKNFDTLFKYVREQCADAYFRTLPLKEVVYNLQYGIPMLKDNWFQSNEIEGAEDGIKEKRRHNLQFFEDTIHRGVVVSYKIVLDHPKDKKSVVSFVSALINECFGDHYENTLKNAEYLECLGVGARKYLKAIFQSLQELQEKRANKEEKDEISHLLGIGLLVLKLMEHSELRRFMESFEDFFRRLFFFFKILDITKNEDSDKFCYHVNQVKIAAEEVFLNMVTEEININFKNSGVNEERTGETSNVEGNIKYGFEKLYE